MSIPKSRRNDKGAGDLPGDQLTEQAVLGAALAGTVDIAPLFSRLTADSFLHPAHRLIFAAMLTSRQRGGLVDVVSTHEILRTREELDAAGGEAYLRALIDRQAETEVHLRAHCERLRAYQADRRGIQLAERMASYATNGKAPAEWLPLIQAELGEVQELVAAPVTDDSYKIERLGAFLEREIAHPPWLIPDLLAPGLCLFSGRPKHGKSTMALNLTVAMLSERGRFLGREVHMHGSPLLILLESFPGSGVQRDLKTMGLTGAADGEIALRWPPMREGGLERLAKVVADTRPPLIVIDTLTAAFPGLDVNDHRDCSAALRPLHTLAATAGTTILLIHHLNKAVSPDDPAAAILGSTALSAIPDLLWTLLRRGRGEYTLTVEGREIPSTEILLRQDRRTLSWQVAADERGVKTGGFAEELLEALDALGGVATADDLAAHLSAERSRPVSRAQVARYLTELHENLLIDKVERTPDNKQPYKLV